MHNNQQTKEVSIREVFVVADKIGGFIKKLVQFSEKPALHKFINDVIILNEAIEQLEVNKTTGWWNIDYIFDNNKELAEKKKHEKSNKAFTNYLIDELRKNSNLKLIQIRQFWLYCCNIETERAQILIDAIDAHINKKYTLSVPALLPQIEYLYKNKVRINGKTIKDIYGQISINDDKTDHFEEDQKSREAAMEYYFEVYPLHYCYDQILFPNREKRARQEKLGMEIFNLSCENVRHLILHGDNAGYAKEEISTRLVLFVDTLLHIIAKQG